MIDFIILEQMTAFAVIMQKHPGWVGKCLNSTINFMQPQFLEGNHCLGGKGLSLVKRAGP